METDLQTQLQALQIVTDSIGYIVTLLAAIIIAIPLLLRVFSKNIEKQATKVQQWLNVLMGVTTVSLIFTLFALSLFFLDNSSQLTELLYEEKFFPYDLGLYIRTGAFTFRIGFLLLLFTITGIAIVEILDERRRRKQSTEPE